MTTEYFGFIFGKLRIPLHIFLYNSEGWSFKDVLVEYRVDPLDVEWNEEKGMWMYNPKHRFGKRLYEKFKVKIDEIKRKAEATGKTFFDGQQVRLIGYRVQVDDVKTEKERPVLITAPGSYFPYNFINFNLDEPLLEGGRTIREVYKPDVRILDGILENNIGVSTTLISEPDWALVYVERSEKLKQYPGLLGTPAAGFIKRPDDMIAGAPNPFKTIQREAGRERGIDIELEDFKLFTVARAMDDFHGELFGEVRVDMTVNEIKSTPTAERWEQKGPIKDVPFEIKDVLKLLKGYTEPLAESNPGPWVPAHAVDVVQSLIKEYGYKKVKRSVDKL